MTPDPWNTQPVQPVQPVSPVQYGGGGEPERNVLDWVHDWFNRYITVINDHDLDLLALWTVHTHVVVETYTTPRLLIDSPVPGSGKTTVLEHLERLCHHPVQMASLSSPALLVRMLDAGLRTILIDEADRSLAPDRPDTGDLLAVLNSGYKRGAKRPVLVPGKGGKWDVNEMPTFSPVAMAGNSPRLPDDTQSRSIRVLLMPDIDGTAEESDWELIEGDAEELAEQIRQWADFARDDVRLDRPDLPEGIRGRARERWAPLKRVAQAAGGHWPAVVDRLAIADVERISQEREEGIVQQRPHVTLLTHIHAVWGEGTFVPTEELIERLVEAHPEMWGEMSSYGRKLTSQRLGRMLSNHYGVHTSRPDSNGPRGYTKGSLAMAFRQFGLDPGIEPAKPAEPAESALTWDELHALHSELAQLPGRCNECAWHVEEQGHAEGCSKRKVATRTVRRMRRQPWRLLRPMDRLGRTLLRNLDHQPERTDQ
jgi:hypothetical protein